ncbi:DNA-methyltransferase [Thiomicrospira cyclica]|uniref:site-specific DNA-methyltransferase (cytosine-N(4)-specific) n=1 Tax=Thiomicrospira cyclica (strain DSM 14477 / JCM 11371 / ALM1) TaxID=717773 RepID=F6DCN5_THICA|nr:site-specific DNA-methyltransferase [Thiomicrospira cyclica]AEG31621.1 DNA methylase N-4/N-6 domain protein [Thiomicrospira cyclica ALM1]
MKKSLAIKLLDEFNNLLSLRFECPLDLMDAAERATLSAGEKALRPSADRSRELFTLVNSKLGLNKQRIKVFIDLAAKQRQYFNYHDKNTLATLFDNSNHDAFAAWCEVKGISNYLLETFNPITIDETVSGLHDFLKSGSVNRSDARDCAIEEKQVLIQRALFGGFVFCAFEDSIMHKVFNEDALNEYHANFFNHLRTHHYKQLHRECALIYQDVDIGAYVEHTDQEISDLLLTGVRDSYERLANHCYFAMRLRAAPGGEARQWRLFADIIIYAEKHREIALSKGYFRPNTIREITKAYIGEALNSESANFELVNEGFFFKDCFILSHADEEGTTNQLYDILILFEKNERDERVIPCPACRSHKVGGNSYPTIGIRSWECKNLICPERSAYDRGNRYSLASIMKQEAIVSAEDQIPIQVRRRWRNDVLFGVRDEEIIDMLVRQFSLHKDRVLVIGQDNGETTSYLGRKIVYESFGLLKSDAGIRNRFFDSAFFKRFALERSQCAIISESSEQRLEPGIRLINVDCESGLKALPPESIDGAVTSPPYFNAREYSQWPNIYCYLFDMFNASRAVFKVLKPGSLFIYNIFDYFDNENIVAFSTMGRKRMILGAYIIHLFEKAGFKIADNVIWFKGDIEGKRNFNGGNTSPYYQLPFNCWEHCLVFRKPGAEAVPLSIKVLKQRPVFKMVRGKNTHGHTAPFPPEIPQLLIDTLPKGAVIVDPYGGSMTTACVAVQNGMAAIMFELDKNYFELGLKKVQEAMKTTSEKLSDR